MEWKPKLTIDLDTVTEVEIIERGRKYDIKDYIAKTIREIEVDKMLDKRAKRRRIFGRVARERRGEDDGEIHQGE